MAEETTDQLPEVRAEEGEDFTDPVMRALWDRINSGFAGHVTRMLADLQRLFDKGELATPLSTEARMALEKRLAMHAAVFLAGLGFPSALGMREPEVTRAAASLPWAIDLIETAWKLGMARRTLGPPTGATAAPARTNAISQVDVDLIALIRERAGTLLRPLVFGMGKEVERRLVERDAEIAIAKLVEGVASRIPTGRLAGMMADLTGHVTDRGDGIPILTGGKWDRDWRRVARTEMARAHNTAALMADLRADPVNDEWKPGDALKLPKRLVFKITQEVRRDEAGKLIMPCKHCLRIWRADDDTPRLYALAEVVANGENATAGPGGTPLPAAKALATVGPIHPHCVCGPLQFFNPSTLTLFPGMAQQLAPFAGLGFEGVP